MKRRGACAAGCLLTLGFALGCRKTPAPAVDTGAREVARRFCEALCRQEWSQAYGALHPDSMHALTEDQFAGLAVDYRSAIGFVPDKVRIRSWEEQDTRAIVHLVFTGKHSSRQRNRETVLLKKTRAGWGVVLPDNFGRASAQ